MRRWQEDLDDPVPTFAHTIHDALVEREEERVREAQEAREKGLRTDGPPVDADPREAARKRVTQRHGTPGRGLTVRREHLSELPDHVLARIALRQGQVWVHGGGSTIRADCPGCGRHEQSWALVDLRGLEGKARDQIEQANLPNHPPGQIPPYACHACWSAWIRDGIITKAELIEGLGAPEERVEKVKQMEEVGP